VARQRERKERPQSCAPAGEEQRWLFLPRRQWRLQGRKVAADPSSDTMLEITHTLHRLRLCSAVTPKFLPLYPTHVPRQRSLPPYIFTLYSGSP
jgi:hypothetical protein